MSVREINWMALHARATSQGNVTTRFMWIQEARLEARIRKIENGMGKRPTVEEAREVVRLSRLQRDILRAIADLGYSPGEQPRPA